MYRQLAILDTGAGRNFIRLSAIPRNWYNSIKEGPVPDIRDANKRPIQVVGAISLCVQLGTQLVMDEFLVCERLAAPVILGCTHMDRHVRAIFPMEKRILLQDGSSETIVRRPLRRPPTLKRPGNSQEKLQVPRLSNRVRVVRGETIAPGEQRWIRVSSRLSG
eukprot:IDg22177t1